MDMMMKTSGEMTLLGQNNADAFMKFSQLWTTGCQAIGQGVAAATEAHFELLMSGWNAMSGAKSFKEIMEMQASLMRASLENAAATTGKIGGAAMALVEESMAPLTASLTTAAEKFMIDSI